MKTIMLIVMFFVVGALFIISEDNLNIGKGDNAKVLTGMYLSWLDETFDNMKTLTGNIVKLNWLPDFNSTR